MDNEQMQAICGTEKAILVIAGAGCGKTTTIVGKIKYAFEKGMPTNRILVISFTNASVNDLKSKLSKNDINGVDVFTFHKLSLEILKKSSYHFEISDHFLELVIDDYFDFKILDSKEAMYDVLRYYNKFGLDILKEYKKLNTSGLRKLLSRYIKAMKTNGYDLDNFTHIDKKKLKKNRHFLKLAILIYQLYEYEKKVNQVFDFEDLIIKATSLVEKVNLNYDLVIIDEYQDTSEIRFNLIKKIIDKNKAFFFAVGDDFQSIYRFAGCNLNIMLNFKKYFIDGKIYFITKTYRNSMELLKIAGDFIMRNTLQIRKELKSDKTLEEPIKFVNYIEPKKVLKRIIDQNKDKKVLILGRNNNDIERFGNFPNYLTVHKSKGLEEEVIIIINLENKLMGFPSKIKEDKILNDILPFKDNYPYSEERRLFYVAITRTKSVVYLLTPFIGKSIFVKELKKIVKSSKVR